MESTYLKDNLVALQQRIQSACETAKRPGADVTLIAASKTRDAATISAAYALGLRHYGENYVDEAITKRAGLSDTLLEATTWHFIGRIQSNKTRQIAEHFDWVHTLDREKIAQRLSNQTSHPLNVLIQVNITADTNKGGVTSEQAAELVACTLAMPNLKLRGLMTILDPAAPPRASYDSMAQLAERIGSTLSPQQQAEWGALSMGMSGDLDDAIAAGATHIRIGTDLFGPRGT